MCRTYNTADAAAFIRAILAAPDDDLPRLIYADWLAECGRIEESDRIRASGDIRIVKVTETTNTGLPNAYGYSRKCARIVICTTRQRGWRSERGVRIVAESDHYSLSRGPKSNRTRTLAEYRQRAEKIAGELGTVVWRG